MKLETLPNNKTKNNHILLLLPIKTILLNLPNVADH